MVAVTLPPLGATHRNTSSCPAHTAASLVGNREVTVEVTPLPAAVRRTVRVRLSSPCRKVKVLFPTARFTATPKQPWVPVRSTGLPFMVSGRSGSLVPMIKMPE